MVSPSSSLFSIYKNAFQGIYAIPQLKMPKIFNKIVERSLTKGGLETSSCPCAASSKWSHSNAIFTCAWAVAFHSFHHKIDWASLKMWAFITKWFQHRGPLSWIEGHPWFPFLAMSSCTFYRCTINIHFAFLQPCNTISGPFWPIWHPSLQFEEWEGPPRILHQGVLEEFLQLHGPSWIVHQLCQLQESH